MSAVLISIADVVGLMDTKGSLQLLSTLFTQSNFYKDKLPTFLAFTKS